MSDEELIARTARLASFVHCDCTDFRGHRDHLSVMCFDLDLTALEDTGVAVSYTWGEFERRDRCIGHFHEEPNHLVNFRLGSEWSVPNFANRLAELTNEYGLCWIDQICVPQKDDEIRETLASIPTIYKSLAVIALLPGSLCKCLSEAYEQHEMYATEPNSSRVRQIWQTHRYDHRYVGLDRYNSLEKFFVNRLQDAMFGAACLNSNGSCSWPYRIWTYQESRYCKSLRVLWADTQPAPCYFLPDLVRNNSPQTDAIIHRKLPNARRLYPTMYELIAALRTHNLNFAHAVCSTMNYHDIMTSIYGSRKFEQPYAMLSPFLLSQPLRFYGYEWAWDTHEEGRIRHLLIACDSIVSQQRYATESRDYVISMFTDWNQYVIPRNFKTMPLGQLLNDAIGQVSQSCPGFDVYIPNRVPAGMLDSCTSGSANHQYSRDKNLANSKVEDSQDIFSMFEWDYWRKLPKGSQRIPLKAMRPGHSPEIISFREWCRGWTIPQLLEQLRECSRLWSWLYIKHKRRLTVAHWTAQVECWENVQYCSSLEEAARLTLYLFCVILNLDFEVCLQNHIDLMFTRRKFFNDGPVIFNGQTGATSWHPPRTHDTYFMGLVNWRKLMLARSEGKPTVSIAIKEPREMYPGDGPMIAPYYEARLVGNSFPPEYEVIGCWVPLKDKIEDGAPQYYIPINGHVEVADAYII